jgi:hypothetical protein
MVDVSSDKLKVTIENFDNEGRQRKDSLLSFTHPQNLKIQEEDHHEIDSKGTVNIGH